MLESCCSDTTEIGLALVKQALAICPLFDICGILRFGKGNPASNAGYHNLNKADSAYLILML